MAHGHEEIDPTLPVQEDPSALPTLYIGVVGILLTAISVLLVHWIFYAVDVQIAEEVYSQDLVEYSTNKREQTARLDDYRWTEKKDGAPAESGVGIPIDHAMRQIVSEYGK